MIYKNRVQNDNGVSYGGVAILWREALGDYKKIQLASTTRDFELMLGIGSLRGHSRKHAVLACYIPPNYVKKRGKEVLDRITDSIVEIKQRYSNPYIIIAGNFNQWDVPSDLEDFADLKKVMVGPTRKDKSIDRMWTNFSRSIYEAGTLDPLVTDDEESASDHRVGFCRSSLRSFE